MGRRPIGIVNFLAEPATALTDYALALFSAYLALRMSERVRAWRQTSAALWRAAFVCAAIAAGLGGTYHGFYPYLSPDRYLALWLATYYLIGAANCLIAAGACIAVVRPKSRRWLVASMLAYCLYSEALLIAAYDNRYILYSFAGMLAILLLQAAYARFARKERYAKWIFAGALLSLSAGIIQAGHLAPSPAFDHNALFHVIQMPAIYCFYRGGLFLVDRA